MTGDEKKALALYREGDRRYAEGRYEEALVLFKQAYELSPAPLLLYNMANAYERLGNYAEAARSLSGYIGSGDVRDADTLRQRLHQIRARARRRATFDAEVAALRTRPARCSGQTPCEVAKSPTVKNASVAYVLFAGGGAMLVGSVVFGAMASGAGADARDACRDSDAGLLCSSDAQEAVEREKRFALATDLSVGLGLAAIGAGVYFYLDHRRTMKRAESRAPRTVLSPSVSRGGMGVTLVGHF